MENMGIQNLVIHPFDTVSQLTAEEFVRTVLVNQFDIHKIIIGHDHRFGRDRTANIDDLISFGKRYGFEVEQISVQEINDLSISSTKIRKAISQGNMPLANEYLGYDYFFGTVFKEKLVEPLGSPRKHKIEEDYKLIPHNGVYVVKSIINQNHFGMMNIGFNPLYRRKLSIEVHFLISIPICNQK
jgi:riboflavin kinase/FMN adenylyltransferase